MTTPSLEDVRGIFEVEFLLHLPASLSFKSQLPIVIGIARAPSLPTTLILSKQGLLIPARPFADHIVILFDAFHTTIRRFMLIWEPVRAGKWLFLFLYRPDPDHCRAFLHGTAQLGRPEYTDLY